MTSQPIWHFRLFNEGDNVSDPEFAKALFSRDDAAAATSLVREAIQNSLDARVGPGEMVHVRFGIHSGSGVSLAKARPFLSGLWDHLRSDKSGLESPPDQGDSLPFLTVEDFGTRGLVGDPKTWDPFEVKNNAFFLFFRALGRSGKQGEERGRWGVGKFVFPMASRGHSLLALTIPADSKKPLLMGRSVLNTHRAEGVTYHPDGHWGVRESSPLVLPVSSDQWIKDFCTLFRLTRQNETGLSIVVPWVDGAISAETLVSAAISEYFLPVLRSELTVEVADDSSSTIVDAERIADVAEGIESPIVRARVQLGIQAATWPATQLLAVPKASAGMELDWVEKRLTEEQQATASAKLERGDVVGFRIPTRVRPKNGREADTYFDVFLKQSAGLGRTRPLIVREGITVAEDKTSPLQDYVALIVVDHAPLATFVGDAENPAHIELQADLVKGKYTYAGKLLQLLRIAPLSLVRELEGSDEAADKSLLATFFPRPEPSAGPKKKPKSRDATKGDDVPEVPDVPNTPPRFRISQISEGFVVKGTGTASAGARLTLSCAYEVRRGNPLRKYNAKDFLLGRDIKCRATGLAIEIAEENHLTAHVQDPHFELIVSGFDENRNVVVRATLDDGAEGE